VTTVWVTRTLPGADATAERVRGAGMTALVAPLLEVVFEPGDAIDLTDVDVLAFTSANGVRAFAARSASRDRPVFAVGRATAKAAREAGFATVNASDGDVLTLARALPHGGRVLHPGAAEPAADLIVALERRGITARGLIVYRTVPAVVSQADLGAASSCDFVLLQSVKAATASRDLRLELPILICLSPAIAAAARPGEGAGIAHQVVVARKPTEDALIAALIDAAR